MSLWTYFLPRRIASSRPIGSGSARSPCFSIAADMTRQNAWEVFGIKTMRSFLSFFSYFTGYGSVRAWTGASSCFSLCIRTVSIKDRTRIRSGPWISLSSSFKTSGIFPDTCFMRRMISSER